jgi:hypothetical protein
MVGWTFVAIDQAFMTMLDRATRRATTRKARTPIGAHLDLPSNPRHANRAYKRHQVYQACSKYLQFFWRYAPKNRTWVEGYGEKILDSGTYKPTIMMGTKNRMSQKMIR